MINIAVTTCNRQKYLERCISSIVKNTVVPYNLFVYNDASIDGTEEMLKKSKRVSVVINGNVRRGIVHGFNTLWLTSESYNKYPYFCYVQDDVVISENGWLKTLIGCYEEQKKQEGGLKVGLFSGHHAPEHPVVEDGIINCRDVLYKKSMRATNMIAPYDFWHKIGYVPHKNPDGSPRGFPGPCNKDGTRGKGSNIDLYITGFQSKGKFAIKAAGKTCSWNLGTYCMIVPGIVNHTALSADSSTWGNANTELT